MFQWVDGREGDGVADEMAIYFSGSSKICLA